jgi:hypothetical protein
MKSTFICASLSGLDVPYLIVTSRVNEETYNLIEKDENIKNN